MIKKGFVFLILGVFVVALITGFCSAEDSIQFNNLEYSSFSNNNLVNHIIDFEKGVVYGSSLLNISRNVVLNSIDDSVQFFGQSFIVEFEQPPISAEYSKLKKQAGENRKYIESHSALNPVRIYKQVFSVNSEDDIKNGVNSYYKKLKSKNEKIKSEILSDNNVKNFITGNVVNDISQENIISSEFDSVFNGIVLSLDSKIAKEIEKVEGVKAVYLNGKVEAFLMDSVPLIGAEEVWGMQDIYGNNITGKNVTIAVLDTGVDYTHFDLGGCFGEGCKVAGGYDIINGDNNPIDDHGHGTHVAATAAGNGVLKGVAPDANILAYKVLDSGGSGSWEEVIEGIERAVDPNQDGDYSDHADVISMSLGGGGNPDDPVSRAVDNAVDAGVVAVIAAGNSGPGEGTIGSPGTSRKAITVGATYKKDYEGQYWQNENPRVNQITSFSSRGPVEWDDKLAIKPDVVAPGALICAARYDSIFPQGSHPYYYPCVDENHIQLAGTSMATPIVSGSIALIKQVHPDWTPDEIKSTLKLTANDIGDKIVSQGYGRINTSSIVNLSLPIVLDIFDDFNMVGGDILEIMGTVKISGLSNYTLSYNPYSSYFYTDKWNDICSSSVQVSEGLLCSWNLRDVNEGIYILRLNADINGSNFESYGLVNIVNTKIISPLSLGKYNSFYDLESEVILNSKKRIFINGTAQGYDFDNYTFEWCDKDMVFCTDTGITLENGGNSPINNGLLAYWDVPIDTKSDFYVLKLINRYGGREFVSLASIYLETDLQEGWPQRYYLEGSGGWFLSFINQPTIADVNGDGKDDLITAYGRTINVLDGSGIPLEGWPVQINTSGYSGYAIMQFGSAVADMNGDGNKEIIVADNAGYVHALESDGSYVYSPKQIGYGPKSTPVIEDMNNDGEREAILSDWSSNLYIIDYQGNILVEKFLDAPKEYSSYLMAYDSPVVADMNGDGNKEIIVMSFSSNSSTGIDSSNSNKRIWAFDSNLNVLPNWPKDLLLGGTYGANIVLADLDKDGEKEVIIGIINGTVYAWNLDGSNVNGWPITIENTSIYGANTIALSVGDVNLDRNIEVFFTGILRINLTYDYTDVGCLFAYSNQGVSLESFPVCADYKIIKSGFSNIPTIANIDSDIEMEIIPQMGGVLDVNHIYPFYAVNHDGSIVSGFPKYLDDSGFGTITPAGDIDKDGYNELFIGTWRGTTFAFNLSGRSDFNMWPQYQHDAQHTGCYDCNFSASIRICNNDGYCNASAGENEFNCPADCKVQPTSNCSDIDGYDSSNASFVVYNNNRYDDVCESGDSVREYYCKLNVYTGQNEVVSNVIECKDYCYEGACIQEEAVYKKCDDNDVANNLFVKGNVVFENQNYEDVCAEQGLSVKQYFCVGDKLRNFVKRCPVGTSCSGGICR